jgi:hypothetical protein
LALLEQRPQVVLDAGQPVFPVDLVASLTAASTLPKSKVLAEAMDHLFFGNGLYLTKDGMMWVPSDIDLRFEVVLYCHASVLAGHMGRYQTVDQFNRYFIGWICLSILWCLFISIMCANASGM